MNIKKNINNNTLYFEHNDKYKTISIGMLLFSPFKKKHLSERSLIASLLAKSNIDYPDEQEFNIFCQELYDLGIVSRVSRVGRTAVWSFSVNIVDPHYLDSNLNLFNQALEVLHTCITKPAFNNEKIEKEKRLYIDELTNIYNNKSQYAVQRFIKHMFEGELISINATGEIEEAKKVDFDSIYEEYQELMKSPKVFYVIGDIDEKIVIDSFSKFHFPNSSQNVYQMELLDKETKEINEVKEIIESQNITQSILCMGYRSNILLDTPSYTAMSIFNGMLGQYFHSTLFQVIREQKSLAYYVGSDYNGRKGNLAITAAISSSSYHEVVESIKEIINDYQEGRFDENILELTKKQVISQLKKQEDAPSTIIPTLYSEIAGLSILSLDEKIQIINEITKNDIINVANCLRLDTIYLLKGEYDEKNK